MTLSTNVYVLDQIDAHEVFRFCQGLIAQYDDHRRAPGDQQWTERQDQNYADGTWAVRPGNPWSIDNLPGQDLPAWLLLAHGGGSPLRTAEQAAEHDEDICNIPSSYCYDDTEPLCDGSSHRPACWLKVDFDTAYGYSANGMGCGDLHAALVAGLGQWLTSQGVRWLWQNEFTGEIHDDPRRLIDLCRGGFEAAQWYRTTALPMILAGIVGTDGPTDYISVG